MSGKNYTSQDDIDRIGIALLSVVIQNTDPSVIDNRLVVFSQGMKGILSSKVIDVVGCLQNGLNIKGETIVEREELFKKTIVDMEGMISAHFRIKW